jgi:hypothetical protein
MVRRTISLPESTDSLVRQLAGEDESFSAAVARLIEAGADSLRSGRKPRYVASGAGPADLGRRAEDYLKKLVSGG